MEALLKNYSNQHEFVEIRSPLLNQIRACTACAGKLPNDPKPVLNFASEAKILVVGQAPGTRVHKTGIPWNDPSGDRLRAWLGVDRTTFYNPHLFAIAPIGFCYPGKGKSGDLPPRPECAPLWMPKILRALPDIKLTLLIGSYSQKYFLGQGFVSLTDHVQNWRQFAPAVFPLPHPSPRNNVWLMRHPWFEAELVPRLRRRCRQILEQNT